MIAVVVTAATNAARVGVVAGVVVAGPMIVCLAEPVVGGINAECATRAARPGADSNHIGDHSAV